MPTLTSSPAPSGPSIADPPVAENRPAPPGLNHGTTGDIAAGQAAPRTGLCRRPALLRRARLAALAVGCFLVPWCVLLAAILPATARAQNWSLAWVGLDSAEAVAALATAALLSRADIRASLTATAAGTLLLIDAWFDVCTSAPGADRSLALAEATLVEAPLAIAAWWLALTLLRRSGAAARASRVDA